MSIKLYEAASYYTDALNAMEETGEYSSMVELLDSIDTNIKDKVESIGEMITNFEAEAAALEAEAKRLKDRADTAKKKANNLLQYVEYVMSQNQFDELKGLKHTFKFKESISLVCHDVKLLPRHFQKPQPPKADIAGLKEDFKKRFDDKGTKLVNTMPKKPKGNEMLVTDLNESIIDMGLEFVRTKKLSMK